MNICRLLDELDEEVPEKDGVPPVQLMVEGLTELSIVTVVQVRGMIEPLGAIVSFASVTRSSIHGFFSEACTLLVLIMSLIAFPSSMFVVDCLPRFIRVLPRGAGIFHPALTARKAS